MYLIEGNIGAGKSTFLTMIASRVPDISVSLEPLHNWQKQVYGQSLLANFFAQPQRWAYTMETLIMMCRVKEHLIEQEKNNGVRLMERSIYSGHYCFAHNSHHNGYMSELEWSLYEQWFNFLIPDKCKAPRGFIYLYVDPEVAYKRIKKRNRLAEKKITLAYLKQIDKRHEDLLINKKNILSELANVPVLVLDCNEEFETNLEQFEHHVHTLELFLAKTERERLNGQKTAVIQGSTHQIELSL